MRAGYIVLPDPCREQPCCMALRSCEDLYIGFRRIDQAIGKEEAASGINSRGRCIREAKFLFKQ